MAKLFRMVKLAENIGFGLEKIDTNWKAYNSTVPDYQIEFDSVIVDFKMEADEHVEQTSGKTSGKILELVKENKYISIPEMAKIIGVSERSIERNIENLKNDDLLKRVGPAKGGYWKATEGYTMLKTTKIIYDTLNIEIL